jgi:hypothetical protein
MNKLKDMIKNHGLDRQILFLLIVVFFFSTAMTWVELDTSVDHQKNVDILRNRVKQEAMISHSDSYPDLNLEELNPYISVRQTDGMVFGGALLVVIIISGVIANIKHVY